MTLYDENLEFFKENLKSIYDIIVSEESIYQSNIEVVNNPLNCRVKNEDKTCFIHSRYDIERENNEIFKKVDRDAERLILFGMGFGYCIDYIAENFKKLTNLTIIEPDLNIFKTILNHVNMEKIIERIGNVTLVVNRSPEEVFEILYGYNGSSFMEKLELVFNISYRSLYCSYYDELHNKTVKYLRHILINMATDEEMRHEWAENSLKNFEHDAVLLENFKDKFTEIPIIIVSAGPSLNYVINYLDTVKNKALIIAVGSAIKILDSNGIIPHFRIALDGGANEVKIFDEIDTYAAPLIFCDLLNHNIVNKYKGQKFRMVLDVDYLSRYFQKKVYESEYVFKSGFSVANVALDVAIKLGSKKIIFVGQDLCYTEGNLYAKGSWTSDEANNIQFDSDRYIKTKNVLGENVFTDKAFLGMRDLFEKRIKNDEDIHYINATEKGLNINGTENKTFAEVMEQELQKVFDINSIISKEFQLENNKDKIMNFKLSLIEDLKQVTLINKSRLKRLKKLNKYIEGNIGIHKLKTETEYIINMEYQLEEIELYKEAMKPMLYEKFKAIYMNNFYNGKDERIIVEKYYKALIGQTVELVLYVEYLQKLLD